MGIDNSPIQTRNRRQLRSDATPPTQLISQATPAMVPCSHPSDRDITDDVEGYASQQLERSKVRCTPDYEPSSPYMDGRVQADEEGHASQQLERSEVRCTSDYEPSSPYIDGRVKDDEEGHASQHSEDESEIQELSDDEEEEETVIPAIEARISYIETEIATLSRNRSSAKAVWIDAQRSQEEAEKANAQAVEEVDLSRKALHTNHRGKKWTEEDHDKFLAKHRRAEREYHREDKRMARKHMTFCRVRDEIREWEDNVTELEKLKEERIALNEKESDMVKQWAIVRDRQEDIKQLVQSRSFSLGNSGNPDDAVY